MDAIADGGDLAFFRCSGVEHDLPRPTSASTSDPIGWEFGILHARPQFSRLAQDPYIADDTATAAVQARSSRVRPNRILLDAQGEIFLNIFHRVVLLRDVIDRIDPIGGWPRP